MNYIKEIEAFEDWLEINHLPATAQLLWYKLLVLCNRAGWAEWLSVTNQALMAKIGASSEKTLIEARNRLKQAGLIDFKTGKKGQPTKYKLFSVEEILQKIHCKNYTVKNTVLDTVNNTVKDTVKTTVKSTDIYKHKQETKTEINIENVEPKGSTTDVQQQTPIEPTLTAKELIAELTRFYQEVTGSSDRKDFAYVGGLYNKYGYDEVWNAIDSLKMRILIQPVEEPKSYLAAILNKKSFGKGEKNGIDRGFSKKLSSNSEQRDEAVRKFYSKTLE